MTRVARVGTSLVVVAFLALAGWLVIPVLRREPGGGPQEAAPLPDLQDVLADAPAARPVAAGDAPVAPSGAILVRVLDEAGRPTDLVEVAAGIAAERVVVMGVRTGPGRFRVEGLDDAKVYRVAARAAACAPAVVGGVRPGGKEVTLQVRPAVTLHGVVVDAAGEPIRHARVRLTAAVPGLDVAESRIERTVDEAGRFRFAGLPRVSFVLEATEAIGEAGWTVAFEGVVADAEPERELRVVLDVAGFVEGRVLDPDGAPVEGIEVKARREGASGFQPETITGTDGAFRLRPGSGNCALSTRDASGLRRWEAAQATVATPASGVELRVRPAANPLAGVAGRFVFPGGVPPRAIAWTLVPAGGKPSSSGSAASSSAVDAAFREVTAFPGTATFHAISPAGWATVDAIPLVAGIHAPLGDVTLQPGVTVKGRVVLPGGGPAKGALLFAPPFDTPWHGQPDEDGSFEIGAFPPGPRTLAVTDLVHEPLVVTWTGDAGATVDLGTLRLEPGTAVVTVRISAKGGGALPAGLTVELQSQERVGVRDPGSPSARVEGGVAAFRAVPAGRWAVFVHVGGDATWKSGRATQPFDLAKGANVELAVEW